MMILNSVKCAEKLIESNIRENEKNRDIKNVSCNSGYEISLLEIVGILLLIIGVIAAIFFAISINDDMRPHGLEGIRGDYQYPFSQYEKQQLFKLGLSIFSAVQGVLIWAMGRLGGDN